MQIKKDITREQYEDIKNSCRFYFSEQIQELDHRVQLLSEVMNVAGMKILDIGSLDGYIACSLASLGAKVTTIDIRPKNLFTAMGRALLLGLKLDYEMGDVETLHEQFKVDEFQMIFHSGVFYHLKNPVKHLYDISKMAKYIVLEGHIGVKEPKAVIEYNGKSYSGWLYQEGGWADPCSSKDLDKSFWVTRESLDQLIEDAGLIKRKTLYDNEPNQHGPRVCYLLERR